MSDWEGANQKERDRAVMPSPEEHLAQQLYDKIAKENGLMGGEEIEDIAIAVYCNMRFQRCDDREDDEADADRCLQRAEAFVAAREARRKRLEHMASLIGTKENKR